MTQRTSKPEYQQAREQITKARDSLEALRQYKIDELRRVEAKLTGMDALFGGKSGKA
jgi:hypothetical protein